MMKYLTKIQNCSTYLIFSLAGKELVRMIKNFSLSNEPVPVVHSERLRGCKTKSGHMCFLLRLFPSMCFLNGAFHSGRSSQSQASILSMFPKQQPHIHPSAFSVQQGWTSYHPRPQILLWYKLSSGLWQSSSLTFSPGVRVVFACFYHLLTELPQCPLSLFSTWTLSRFPSSSFFHQVVEYGFCFWSNKEPYPSSQWEGALTISLFKLHMITSSQKMTQNVP